MICRGKERWIRYLIKKILLILKFSQTFIIDLCPQTGIRKFGNETAAQRVILFYSINSTTTVRVEVTVRETQSKRSASWYSWILPLNIIEIEHYIFLDGFSRFQQTIIFAAYSRSSKSNLQ